MYKVNGIDIWYIDIDRSNYQYAKELASSLSFREKTKLELLRFFKDQAVFLISHIILRVILSFYSNIKPKDIEYSFSQYGKPFCSNIQSLYFNMSHSNNKIIIGLSNNDIGIDIEYERLDIDQDSISKIIFSEREREYLNRFNKGDSRKFYELWTKKEALLKGIGTGLCNDIKSIEVAEVTSVRDESGQLWRVESLYENMSSHYMAAISYQKESRDKLNHFSWASI